MTPPRPAPASVLVAAAAVAALVAVVGVGTAFAPSGSGKATPPAAGPARPPTTGSARGLTGEVAFVSRGTLWVRPGSSRSVIRVPTGGLVPDEPAFSADGRWLSFVASTVVSTRVGGTVLHTVVSSSLWMARADGRGARAVTGADVDHFVGWSPRTDLVAVTVGRSTVVPLGAPTAVDVVGPSGATRAVSSGRAVTSAVWSPDGANLAVSTESTPARSGLAGAVTSETATLTAYPVSGGAPMVWLADQPGYVVTAGWWPVWGIGYTTVEAGAVPGGSATLDGSPLFALAVPGARPHLLGTTLEDDGAGGPVATASGWLAFVSSAGPGGRTVWEGKQVEVCSPQTRACTPVPGRANTVTLDPAWSPDGRTLAYVEAPELPTSGFPQAATSAWYRHHRLLLVAPGSAAATARTLRAPGATVPVWGRDGARLLYVSGNALWVRRIGSAAPARVAGPLFAPGAWPNYYGQVSFSTQFAWSAATPAVVSPVPDPAGAA